MDPAPGALVVMALLLFIPGGLLYLALKPRGGLLECVALAPALSLALVFLVGQVCTVAGLPFDPLRFAVALGIIGVAAVFRLRGRATVASEPADLAARTASRQAGALLAAGMLLCGFTWAIGLQGLATTPPNRDSANHGVMAAQVARLETMDHARVLNSDVLGGAQKEAKDTAFYPLALHGEVALANRVAGIPIADGLLAATLLFAAVVLPLGLFLLTKALVPQRPIVAGLAALLLAGTGCLPLAPMYFGGMALIAGISVVPAATVVASRYLTRGGWASGLIVALAAVGIAATHTSEVPLLAIMAGALLAEAIVRTGGRTLALAAARRSLGLGITCALLMLPTLGALAGGTTERSGFDDSPVVSLPAALRGFAEVVAFPNRADAVVLLALAGLGLCLWRGRQLAMACALVSAAGLYVVAATVDAGPLHALTLPWYHHPARLAINAALLVPFFGAVAVAAASSHLARLIRRDRSSGSLAVLIASIVAIVLGLTGMVNQGSTFRTMFQRLALVDSDALAAFSYLEGTVQPGERVLNDLNNDGGIWMYAFNGVPPVFGFNPARPSASWQERSWMLSHLSDLGADPKVAALLEENKVRFVYLNERQFDPRHARVLSVEALRTIPHICQRLHRGTSYVFEVVPASDCA